MRYKYELGEKLSNGLHELYRDGVKTSAQIKSLDLIKNDEVFIDDGKFRDGELYGGAFCGGFFYGGIFHGGEFFGGWFHGGRFRRGYFYGGEFLGGYFTGGYFTGGCFLGGSYKNTPLQIYGSKHYLNYTEYNGEPSIRIGCHTHSIEYWLKNYAEIGAEKDYSDEQIDEYKGYIDLFARRYLR